MNEPVPVPDRLLSTDEVLTRVDLESEAQTLGPDGGLRRLREGRISIGRPRIIPLRTDDLPEPMLRRPDVTSRRFVVMHLPFDLDEVRGSRRYREARFQVVLNVPDAVAHSLWPMLVTTEAEVERSRTFAVGLDLSFGVWDGAPSLDLGRDTVFRYTTLQPTITAFGVGRSTFSWLFTARPTADLEPGNRSAFVVVDLPDRAPTITGRFECEAVVVRKRMGVLNSTDARSRSVPFRVRLDTGETTLVQPPETT